MHAQIASLRQFALHLHQPLNLVGYIVEYAAAESRDSVQIHSERSMLGDFALAEYVLKTAPAAFINGYNAFQDGRDKHYRYTETGQAPLFASETAAIDAFDHYNSLPTIPVFVNHAQTGLPPGPGAGSGGGGGPGPGAGHGGGAGRGGPGGIGHAQPG
jgi:hypothetical protein